MFEKKEIRWLSEDEIKLFKEQAVCKYKNGNDRYIYGLPISLIIYTGLRCGELAALKWSDIDFKNNGIKIHIPFPAQTCLKRGRVIRKASTAFVASFHELEEIMIVVNFILRHTDVGVLGSGQ